VVADFTCSSISSTVFNRFVEMTVDGLSSLLTTEEMMSRATELLVDELDATLTSGLSTVYPDSELVYAKTKENGYVVLTVNGDKVSSIYRTFPHTEAKTSAYGKVSSLTVTDASFEYDGTDVVAI